MNRLLFASIIGISLGLILTPAVQAQNGSVQQRIEVRTFEEGVVRRQTTTTQDGIVTTTEDERGDVSQDIQQRRQEVRDTIDARRTQVRDQVADRREELQQRREELRAQVASSHANRLQQRFQVYSTRLRSVADRLSDRIAELTTAGVDTTQAVAALAAAQTALQTADQSADSAVSAFQSLANSPLELDVDGRQAAIDLAQEARRNYVEALRQLQAAIRALRNQVSVE